MPNRIRLILGHLLPSHFGFPDPFCEPAHSIHTSYPPRLDLVYFFRLGGQHSDSVPRHRKRRSVVRPRPLPAPWGTVLHTYRTFSRADYVDDLFRSVEIVGLWTRPEG